jgi:hypothetical protein
MRDPREIGIKEKRAMNGSAACFSAHARAFGRRYNWFWSISMLKLLVRISPLLLAISSLSAGPCMPDTLAHYETLTSCNVGPLIFSGFTFSQSGTVTVGDTNIMVAPVFGIIDTDYGLSFTSTGFKVSGTDTSTYVITYLEDPTGPIRSLDDVLDDPVLAPGRAEVDTVGCLGAAFTGAICPTSTVSIMVFDDGIAPQKTASVSFPGQTMVGIQNMILLKGNTTGSVNMNGVAVASQVPEPGTGWLSLAVVLALFLARKPPLKRLQVRLQHRP